MACTATAAAAAAAAPPASSGGARGSAAGRFVASCALPGMCCVLVLALPSLMQAPSSLFVPPLPEAGRTAAASEAPGSPPATASGRRSVLNLGGVAAAAAASSLVAPEQAAWADGNPFPYDTSRGKIAKKLAPFTGSGCPENYLVQISLGDSSDGLKFIPDKINLVQGCYTELALSNPSSLEHNFVAPDFTKSVYTVVILAGSPPAELKGQAVELELKPGASLGWFLVPVKAGDFELRCTVKGHLEGGMVGRVNVAPRAM